MEINKYIQSGILESYVLGSTTATETGALLQLKAVYPEIDAAIKNLESNLELIAEHMAMVPPPGAWNKIEKELHEIVKRQDFEGMTISGLPEKTGRHYKRVDEDQFIEVQGPSSHMRVHKIWRWIIIAIFILGKIFLGFAIYFYLENRQLNEKMEKQRQELKKN